MKTGMFVLKQHGEKLRPILEELADILIAKEYFSFAETADVNTIKVSSPVSSERFEPNSGVKIL